MTRRQRSRAVLTAALGLSIALPLALSTALTATDPPSASPSPTERVRQHRQRAGLSTDHLYETEVTNEKTVVDAVRALPDAVETTRYVLMRRGSTWTAPRVLVRRATPRRGGDE